MGGGRPKNLRRGYFTPRSEIPYSVVKALERSSDFKLLSVKLAWQGDWARDGKSAWVNTLRVTWPTRTGNTLERQKAHEGIGRWVQDVKVLPRYGFATGAKPWRQKKVWAAGWEVCKCQTPQTTSFLNVVVMLEEGQEGIFTSDELVKPGCEGKPLKSETPWTLPAWNKAGRSGEEKAAERVKNPVGGTYPVR